MADDLDTLLRELDQEEEPSEDRTVFARETSDGLHIDFEIRERTSFAKSYPETVRELRTKAPLSCFHVVTKDNPFGAYFAAPRFGHLFTKKRCANEVCSRCSVTCARCGISLGPCCAVPYTSLDEQVFLCRRCRRRLRTGSLLVMLAELFIHPFVSGKPEEHEEADDR